MNRQTRAFSYLFRPDGEARLYGSHLDYLLGWTIIKVEEEEALLRWSFDI